jgi:5-methylcytosine-specific restriction endonuclease McrA
MKLNCHHIIPYSENENNEKNNLISLCTSCHAKIDMMYTNECRRPMYFSIINEWRNKTGIW